MKEMLLSNAIYGYARVSTKDQNLDRQLDALLAFPVDESNVFTDKAIRRPYLGGGASRAPRRQGG